MAPDATAYDVTTREGWLRRAAEITDRRIPPRFRSATATDPEIAAWCRNYGPDSDSLLLLGVTGAGKALADETELATPAGPKAIGSAEIGDIVFGGDGSPCRICAVYPQGTRPLWRVKFRDGRSVVCDPDHLWLATSRTAHWRGTPPKVVSLAEMMQAGLFYADGSCKWYLPVSGPAEYETSSDLPVEPYTLGALIGDGCLRSFTPDITTMDAEIIDALQLPPGVTARSRPRQRNSRALTWTLAGRRPDPNPLTLALRELGLMGHLSAEKFIPDTYLQADVNARLALLAGLVDTDGYVNDRSACVTTSSPDLARDIQRLAWSLGGSATSRRKETTHRPAWTVHFSLPAAMGCPARLGRKRERWTPRRDGRGALVPIVGVEPVPDGPATCITVDSPDSTYLTADYIRTHNTWQAFGAIRTLAAKGTQAEWAAVTAPDLYALLRPRDGVDSETEFRRWADVPLLLLDDLGAAKNSEFTEEVNYRLIDRRSKAMTPCLITSNVPVGQLRSMLGSRVASRLREMCRFIEIDGPDQRKAPR